MGFASVVFGWGDAADCPKAIAPRWLYPILGSGLAPRYLLGAFVSRGSVFMGENTY
jgi:hypothetical protein